MYTGSDVGDVNPGGGAMGVPVAVGVVPVPVVGVGFSSSEEECEPKMVSRVLAPTPRVVLLDAGLDVGFTSSPYSP